MKSFALSALIVAAVSQVEGTPANLLEAVTGNDDLSTLETLVGLAEEGTGAAIQATDGTLFAPTNDAFIALGETAGELQREYNKDILTQVLTYHLLAEKRDATAVTGLTEGTEIATALTGKVLTKGAGAAEIVDGAGNTVTVTGATNTPTGNGAFLHTVPSVLLPEEYKKHITEFAGANLLPVVVHAGLVEALQAADGFTLFAPLDEKFADFNTSAVSSEDTADILKYHVVPQVVLAADALALVGDNDKVEVDTLAGEKLTLTVVDGALKVNGVAVSGTDNRALNGVVHIVDEILTPPVAPTTDGPTDEPTSAASVSGPATVVLGAGLFAAIRNMI